MTRSTWGCPLGGTFATALTASLEGFVAGYSTLPDGDCATRCSLASKWDQRPRHLWRSEQRCARQSLGVFGNGHPGSVGAGFLCDRHPPYLLGLYPGEREGGRASHPWRHVPPPPLATTILDRWSGCLSTTTHDPGCLSGGQPQPPFYQVQQALPAVWQNGKVTATPLVRRRLGWKRNANNDLGQITGSSGDCFSNPAAHAVLWQNGQAPTSATSAGQRINQPVSHQQPGSNYRRLRSCR